MAPSGDLIDFEVIESHKENIQALPSGRSAKALAQLYSPPLLGAQPSPAAVQDAHSEKRKVYEDELRNIDEADDPLDVYDRYVKWTLDAYPSAQATPQSQLRPLLERATKAFQASPHYKNDPRYLKIWLHYIRLFSDAPREVFVFLSRHSIGEGLALYYEDFAAWLENAGRWNQAEEVYKMGIEKEARPVERLVRKFGEFEARKAARPQDDAEPSSPALPIARPALAAKIDPFAASPATAQPQQSRSTATKKSKGSKMAVFSDSDDSSRPNSGSGSKGWDNIGSIAERKKENTVEAKPWVGEKLAGGKTNGGMEKLTIFKDQFSSHSKQLPPLPRHLIPSASPRGRSMRKVSRSAHEQQCVPNPKTGKLECVFVNLEAVYPSGGGGEEYSFEELRARHRGWKMGKRRPEQKAAVGNDSMDIETRPAEEQADQDESTTALEPPEPQTAKRGRGFKIFEDALEVSPAKPATADSEEVLVETFSKTLALNDEPDENTPPTREEADLAKRLRREERANRTRKIKVLEVKHIKNETKTIQLNLDSPTGPKLKRKKSSDRSVEPTMTINTKEAMDEIYGIFNAPLPDRNEQTDGEEDEDSEDDYTSGGESTGTGKLSVPGSEYGDETRNELLGVAKSVADEEGRTEGREWSDFSKGEPAGESESTQTQSTTWEVYQDPTQSQGASNDDLVTPIDEDDDQPHTRYVPLPPDGYEPPMGQYRDQAMVANNRLPFMTPIVEQTESSLGGQTGGRTDKDYFGSKTPSRRTGLPPSLPEDDLDPPSSPLEEEALADKAADRRRVLQPIRTKSTKGQLSLGQGSVKAQIAAKCKSETIDIEPSGPMILEERCNPMDPQLRETILTNLQPSLSSYPGYYDHSTTPSSRGPEIRKFIRAVQKAARGDKTASALTLPPNLTFPGINTSYTVKRELGAGTFAPVYLVSNESPDTAHRAPLEALKLESPPSTWEFHILRLSHTRLCAHHRASASLVHAHEMHLYRDEGFLIETFRDQGTLLDLVNLARLENSGLDEMVAMWLSIELFRTVEALHERGIIHGDLKGDNVLVRFDDVSDEEEWSPTYCASGAHGWSSKGISLIDFGRGIDMRQFVPNVGFIADWKTTSADCAEMREGRPWTYQVDYYGLAGIIHSLLFGKYMETVSEGIGSTRRWRIREGLKRYWQVEIWGEVFDLLLNPNAFVEGEVGGKMPVLKGMSGVRERMEAWVGEGCERGVGLKGMVGRMEGLVRARGKKGR